MNGSNAAPEHLIISKGVGIRLATELNSSIIVFDSWVLIQPFREFHNKIMVVVFLMNELEQLRSLRKSCKRSTNPLSYMHHKILSSTSCHMCLQNQ